MTGYAIQDAAHQLAESDRQLQIMLATQYQKELRMGETIWRAYLDFTIQHDRPPLTDEEKKQALLNYMIKEGECHTSACADV